MKNPNFLRNFRGVSCGVNFGFVESAQRRKSNFLRKLDFLHFDVSELSYNNSIFISEIYIRAHIYEKLTTSIVATGLNYSVSYLCAAFKQETGVTLTDYIRQEKISQARYLLEQHKKPADVSRLLECSSPSCFGAVFRKLVGVSPGEYAIHTVYDFQANGRPFAWNP